MRQSQFTVKELEELMLHYSSEIRKFSYQLGLSQQALDDVKKQLDKIPAKKEEVKAVKAEKRTAAAKAESKKASRAQKTTAPAKAAPVAKMADAAEEAPKRKGRPRKTEAQPTAAPSAEAPKRGRGRPKKTASNPVKMEAKPVKMEAKPVKMEAKPVKTASKPVKMEAKPAPIKEKKTRKPAATKMRTMAEEQSKPKGYRLSEWDLFILNSLKATDKAMVKSDFSEKAKEKIKKEKNKMDDQTLQGKLTRSIHKLSRKRGELIKADYPGKGSAYGLAEWADENGDIRKEFTAHFNA